MAMGHADLGVLHFRSRRWRHAIERFRRALVFHPEDLETATYLASALRLSGREKESIHEYRSLIRRGYYPKTVLDGLHAALVETDDVGSMLADLDIVLKADPACTYAHALAADIYLAQGCGDIACDHLRQEGELTAAVIDACRLHYRLGTSEAKAATQLQMICGWVDTYLARPPSRALLTRGPKKAGRMRVGYLTGEFTRVPAYYFIYPFIGHIDRDRVSIYGYHSRRLEDDRTQEFRNCCNRFYRVSDWSDAQILDRIRRDEVDVLVDLSGHFEDNRLGVFRHSPARVSFTYPNHPSTTGVPQIDYIFTDRWIDPPGSPTKYLETAWHLPSGCIPFTGIPGAPPVVEPPCVRNGFVTFGVLQKALKLNDVVYDCIAAAMLETPRSRLVLRYHCYDLENRNSTVAQRVLSEFISRGVSADRVRLGCGRPRREYLASRAEFDIALDTSPYNGQTTTCDSFWMGVPTITLAGETHASRVGLSLLTRVGLEEWVATTPVEYGRLAARHAANVRKLCQLRGNLRQLVREHLSPRVFGREVEEAFRRALV
jgi:predicted O-linked N-acetylglucosamine transferase (SPINDLY family)